MKEFDLDKLERKTTYKVPENFFEEMQANVLKNTTKKEKKETKVFRLHFSAVTSIAAALALIFGFTFLWKTNQAYKYRQYGDCQNANQRKQCL